MDSQTREVLERCRYLLTRIEEEGVCSPLEAARLVREISHVLRGEQVSVVVGQPGAMFNS